MTAHDYRPRVTPPVKANEKPAAKPEPKNPFVPVISMRKWQKDPKEIYEELTGSKQ